MNSPTWTPRELARRYGVNCHKVLHWIRTGELAALNLATERTGRPRWRIPAQAIIDFENRRRTYPAAPKRALRPRPPIIAEDYFP